MANQEPQGPSLYLHVPFCRSKCPYCDFYSVVGNQAQLDGYVKLLLQQLAWLNRRQVFTAPLATVFFGGGTPSLLAPRQVAAILDRIRYTAGLSANAEISLEANPGTVDAASLQGYRDAGVNRLSFGVQSLQDDALQLLGRGHSAKEAVQVVTWARQVGFENVGCDLMFGLPNQGRKELLQDLDALLQLQPDHMSCYGLTVEAGTPFEQRRLRGALALPDEDEFPELYLTVHEQLTAAGFEHYEISNYALPDRRCRHNLAYWRRQPCFAVGAGAHSFIPAGYGTRREVPADLDRYRQRLMQGRDPAVTLETFDRQGAMAETLYLGLRCQEGVSDKDFFRQFGLGVAEAFPEAVRRCGQRLTLDAGRWRFDLQGWLLFDHFISFFL
ncbi:radical SAM family heme chaperone HemW [Syntrophotalea acetylenivorans]|uniref:radical SAM family heme chaperone HemW n=1 Tax=Syntrophotalea acetylenivorans TaxID=1842532 RepID=UPI0013143809|nr:radical SAM family heme chaperone HemW [Syntrophotalea acetylenivorans]